MPVPDVALAGARAPNPISEFVDDPEPHVFEHGHALGERDRLLAAPDLEAGRSAIRLAAAVEIGAERTDRREAFDQPDVGDRHWRHIGCAIRHRKRLAIAADQLLRLHGIVRKRERFGEPIRPGAHQRFDLLLQRGAIRVWRLAAEARDDEVHPHQRAFREIREERRDAAFVDA